MADQEEELGDLSDRLLREVQAVRELERDKREAPISSPAFHRLADEIAARARRVFSIAAEEQATGDQTERSDETIDDVAAERNPGDAPPSER